MADAWGARLLRFFRRKRERAQEIERLAETDLDRAAEELTEHRKRLRPADATRLAALIRGRLQARDHIDFFSRGLADGSIAATAACELLETYREAGYVDGTQFDMLRRHVLDAHRREVTALLASELATSVDYFRAIDGYRMAGYLSSEELSELEALLDFKLNPAMAARRLFAQARTAPDLNGQQAMLERYLIEFEGFEDYPDAASLYLSLRIDQLWKALPGVRFAREAAIAVHELNNLLIAYLPYTGDIGEDVPVERIVDDFMALAGDFKPEPDVDGPITARHLRRKVVVAERKPADEGTYEYERNALVSIGAKGRVVAVRGDRVMVSHQGEGLQYSRSWPQRAFEGTAYEKLDPKSLLASWTQEELGLVKHRRPSPVFVHQYREAVRTMEKLLEQHREDRSLPATRSALPEGDAP